MQPRAVVKMMALYVAVAVAAGLLVYFVTGRDGGVGWPIGFVVVAGVAVTAGQLQGQRRESRV